jgi:hypothetical protein
LDSTPAEASTGCDSLADTGLMDSEAWPAAATPTSKAHAVVNTAARWPKEGIFATLDKAAAGAAAPVRESLRRPWDFGGPFCGRGSTWNSDMMDRLSTPAELAVGFG